jgi:hypothetical protein
MDHLNSCSQFCEHDFGHNRDNTICSTDYKGATTDVCTVLLLRITIKTPG